MMIIIPSAPHIYIYLPRIVPTAVFQIRIVFLEKVLFDSGQIRQKVLVPIDRGHIELQRKALVAVRLTQCLREAADVAVVDVPVAQTKVGHHVDDAAQLLVAFGVAEYLTTQWAVRKVVLIPCYE